MRLNILVIRSSTFYLDFGTTFNVEPVRCRSLIQSELDVTCTPQDGKKFFGPSLRKSLVKRRDRLSGNSNREIRLEVSPAKVRNNVSELVDAQDCADKFVPL
jgi:hypothetical protein